MFTADQPLPRSRWLLSENRRAMIATVTTCVLSAGILTLAVMRWEPLTGLLGRDFIGYLLMCSVFVWMLLTVLHTALTWAAYRGLAGEDFERAVVADPAWRKWRGAEHRSGLLLNGPTSWPVTVSVLALIVVVALVLRPALREMPLALGMALVMVAASWLNAVVVYALHYARMDATGDAFAFPGERPREFSDYLYIALGVQSTFGVTDVEVMTRELRRFVSGQSLLAFAFNTVIVAMILSLFLGIAG